MGYRALKEKAEEKRKGFKLVLLCILVFVLAALTVFSVFVPPESWKYYVGKPKIDARKAGEMRIHYLDVGQGDSTLIELPDGKVMLIDGGNDTKGTKKNILRYLNALDIRVIDYLVITHTDGDHCGGLEEVFRYKKVLNAYLPYADASENLQYAQAYDAALEENCPMVTFSRGIDLSNTDGETPYTLTFLYPYSIEAEENPPYGNDASAVVWLDYKGLSALFLGDASIEVEKKLLRDHRLELLPGVHLAETELLKVAHHGAAESTSNDLLEYLGVEKAFISCGKGNAYGHPHQAVLNRLAAKNIAVYRTDEKGHLVVTANALGNYTVKSVKT